MVWLSISSVDREISQVHRVTKCVLWEELASRRRHLKFWHAAHRCTWHQSIACIVLICWYFSMKFWILFKVISKYILVNFQVIPTICVNFFASAYEFLDSPSYLCSVLSSQGYVVQVYSWYSLVIALWGFLAVPWVCLQFVIVVFPKHTHLLFSTVCLWVGLHVFIWNIDGKMCLSLSSCCPWLHYIHLNNQNRVYGLQSSI